MITQIPQNQEIKTNDHQIGQDPYNLEELEAIRKLGWRTIPINGPYEAKNGKRPFNGYKWKTEPVNEWQPNSGEGGFAFIVPDGYVVVDCDSEEAVNRFLGYIQTGNPKSKEQYSPVCYRKTTKGRHFMFRSNEEWTNGSSNTLLGEGIDIRAAEKGYAIASMGTAYETIGRYTDIGNFPDNRWEKALAESTCKKKESKTSKTVASHGNGKYTSRFDKVDDAWKFTEGERNDRLKDLVWHMANKSKFNKDSLLHWSLYANELMCEPPLPEDEVRAMVNHTHSNRPGEFGNGESENLDVFVPWERDIADLKKTSGFIREVLAKGLKMMGVKVRLNVRTDCVEIWDKNEQGLHEWTTITDSYKKALTSFASNHFVTGHKVILKDKKKSKPADTDDASSWIISKGVAFNWTETDIQGCLHSLASRNKVDPFIVDVLEKLPEWDGKPRVDTLFEDVFTIRYDGTERENELKREILRIATKSLIFGILDRTFNPGCKHDEVVVLISERQGVGKSTFCQNLLPDARYFKDGWNWNCDAKRYVEESLGKSLIEAPEMDGMTRENMVHITSMVSISSQTVRLSYKKDAEDYKSRHVIMGTSNNKSILPYQPNGERRWILFEVDKGKMPPEKCMPEFIGQLWAEALHRWKQGEQGQLDDGEIGIVSENSRFFMSEPALKQAVLDIVNRFKRQEKWQFREDEVKEILEGEFLFTFQEDGKMKTAMRRAITATKKVTGKRTTGNEYLYTFKGKEGQVANKIAETDGGNVHKLTGSGQSTFGRKETEDTKVEFDWS